MMRFLLSSLSLRQYFFLPLFLCTLLITGVANAQQFTAPNIIVADVAPLSVAKTQPTVKIKTAPTINNTIAQNNINQGELDSLFGGEEQFIPDPSEMTNRHIFDFNVFLDRAFLQPANFLVTLVLPDPAEKIISNILDNLNEPAKFIYLTLSGHFVDGLLTLSRFTINSTFGIGGALDPASSFGLTPIDANADLMLASWGVPMGDYSVSLSGGPSHQRAGLAGILDLIINPISIINYTVLFNELDIRFISVRTGLRLAENVIERPAVLDTIADFADPYAVARSAYWQNYQARERAYIEKGKSEEEK